MRNPNELWMLSDLPADPNWTDAPAHVSEISRLLGEQQTRLELAELDRYYRPAPRASEAPGRLAEEMGCRSRFLRSKASHAATSKLELEVLAEVELIEERARALDLLLKNGAVTEERAKCLRDALGQAAFAMRMRFADLMLYQDPQFRFRATPPDGNARQKELDQIEEFLARKAVRQAA